MGKLLDRYQEELTRTEPDQRTYVEIKQGDAVDKTVVSVVSFEDLKKIKGDGAVVVAIAVAAKALAEELDEDETVEIPPTKTATDWEFVVCMVGVLITAAVLIAYIYTHKM